MTKLLKRHRPQPSGSAKGASPTSGTPSATSRRNRWFSVPALVRRLLRKAQPRHPQTSGLDDIESEEAVIAVVQGVAVEVNEAGIEAVAPRQENAGWRLSAPDASIRVRPVTPRRSFQSTLEYIEDNGTPHFPIPLTDSEASQSQDELQANAAADAESASVDIAVIPSSPSGTAPFGTSTLGHSHALTKNEDAGRRALDAGVTGSETTSVDARSSFDSHPGFSSGSGSVHSSESEHFSVHRLEPSAASLLDEDLAGRPNAADATLAPHTHYEVPMNAFEGKRRRLNPYQNPYYEIPSNSRLEDGTLEDGRWLSGATVLHYGPEGTADRGLMFSWKGLIGDNHNGKLVYGAHVKSLGKADTTLDPYPWFPSYVAVKIVSKVDLFEGRHGQFLAYGSVASEAAAMKSLASQPTPSGFVNSALATFQDDYFFYIVSRWYSCTLQQYISQTRPKLLAGHTCDYPYQMPRDVFRFYAAELLLGMEYLEECGVVNCDIKLANIFVSPSGHLALADFDLAVPDVRPAMAAQQCAYKDVCMELGCSGTSTYKAPERFRNSNARGIATPRADIWSLGIVLLEFALQIDKSYFETRFPHLFASVNDADAAMKIIYDDFFWVLLNNEAHNSTGTASLDPLVYGFLVKFLFLTPEKRTTVREAKQHAIFEGLDWDGIRRGAIEPPLLKEGHDPQIHPPLQQYPAITCDNVRMRRLQRNGNSAAFLCVGPISTVRESLLKAYSSMQEGLQEHILNVVSGENTRSRRIGGPPIHPGVRWLTPWWRTWDTREHTFAHHTYNPNEPLEENIRQAATDFQEERPWPYTHEKGVQSSWRLWEQLRLVIGLSYRPTLPRLARPDTNDEEVSDSSDDEDPSAPAPFSRRHTEGKKHRVFRGVGAFYEEEEDRAAEQGLTPSEQWLLHTAEMRDNMARFTLDAEKVMKYLFSAYFLHHRLMTTPEACYHMPVIASYFLRFLLTHLELDQCDEAMFKRALAVTELARTEVPLVYDCIRRSTIASDAFSLFCRATFGELPLVHDDESPVFSKISPSSFATDDSGPPSPAGSLPRTPTLSEHVCSTLTEARANLVSDETEHFWLSSSGAALTDANAALDAIGVDDEDDPWALKKPDLPLPDLSPTHVRGLVEASIRRITRVFPANSQSSASTTPDRAVERVLLQKSWVVELAPQPAFRSWWTPDWEAWPGYESASLRVQADGRDSRHATIRLLVSPVVGRVLERCRGMLICGDFAELAPRTGGEGGLWYLAQFVGLAPSFYEPDRPEPDDGAPRALALASFSDLLSSA
ncbi:unnamed protein product [Peniophora sp. CBMAI 1063]|nr:unnamed protein product [Peniophora sp. CBMAI 1063]